MQHNPTLQKCSLNPGGFDELYEGGVAVKIRVCVQVVCWLVS